MKDAKTLAAEFRVALKVFGPVVDPVLNDGTSMLEALIGEVQADALRHAAAASRNTFSDPNWHGFYHDAVERVAAELEAEAERITGAKEAK